MSEDSRRQTHTTGEVFVHARSKKYRDNYDSIFNKCEDCEDCTCSQKENENSSDA